MPYTVTQAAIVTGSCGSGKTAGVRKLRKDLRILPAALCGFLSTLFTKMANQPTPP